ncbi:MAG: metalloregulator ArsR/SmtB family transcription factor [Candidatus Krumholzibacteriales bacterium]
MRVYADIFKALADETRLAIMALIIRHGRLCVCDVEEALRISQSKASRHLRYLKNCGLLDDRREGTWAYYNLSSKAGTEANLVLEMNSDLIASLLSDEIETRLAEWLRRKSRENSSCKTTHIKHFNGGHNDSR